MNTGKFETGATTHAINDLILFVDTTRELSEFKSSSFNNAYSKNEILLYSLQQLLSKAIKEYKKTFPNKTDHNHISTLDETQGREFIDLYIDEYFLYVSEQNREKERKEWNNKKASLKAREIVEISEYQFNDFLNCLPPAGYCKNGFYMGEPYSHTSQGTPIYLKCWHESGKYFAKYEAL
jgi:hypothetical protein